MNYEKNIKDYYDYTLNLYKVFWHGETRGLHYGVWYKSTQNLKESILNTNELICKYADFREGQVVLDAGCGVGGTSFYIKNKYEDLNIFGITLSEKQLEKANELRERYKLNNIHFSLQNFEKTNFSDNTFDVVFALESVCHSMDKENFLKEANKILKVGGKLIVWDGFLEKESLTKYENKLYKSFCRGFALDNLAEQSTFQNQLTKQNFTNIQNFDFTENVKKTSWRMYLLLVLVGIPTSLVTTFLHLTPKLLLLNNYTGRDQYYLIKNHVMSLRLFVAEKK